jgi:FKBP-type peptidyl-prolyl cis-trans isomerase FklB
MKQVLLTGIVAISLFLASCNNNSTTADTKDIALSSQIDSLSYSLGVLVANDFQNSKFYDTINPDVFLAAARLVFNGDSPKINPQDAQLFMQSYAQQKSQRESLAAKQAGLDYLAENAKKEGVVTLPSGLQYKILNKGTGDSPDTNDVVTVNYEGRLIDGTIFDSSYKNGKPVTFPVNGVIKGWQEALQLMKPGAKWQLYIPYNLAYGERGIPNTPIKAYSTLVFDVELMSVEKK